MAGDLGVLSAAPTEEDDFEEIEARLRPTRENAFVHSRVRSDEAVGGNGKRGDLEPGGRVRKFGRACSIGVRCFPPNEGEANELDLLSLTS